MTRRAIDNLYALTIPEIQEAFLKAMQDIVDRAMLDEMVAAIEAGDADRLFTASGFTPAALSPILDRIEEAYERAGRIEVDNWPQRIRTPTGIIQPVFNMRNPAVEEDLRNFSSQFISRITNEAKDNIRIVLQDGMIRGDNPRRTALDIAGRINPSTRKREGGIVGLTSQQTRAVINARGYLETFDKKYFNLRLRDKRFDRTVMAAIESGFPLSQETISKLITSYKSRALKYRGEMISRTETIQSMNRGARASIEQAISEGITRRQDIKKWWDDSGDGRVRTTHNVLGQRFGRKNPIGFDEPFISPSGARMLAPGDSSLGADASEIVHCRCHARYEIDFVGRELNGG